MLHRCRAVGIDGAKDPILLQSIQSLKKVGFHLQIDDIISQIDLLERLQGLLLQFVPLAEDEMDGLIDRMGMNILYLLLPQRISAYGGTEIIIESHIGLNGVE